MQVSQAELVEKELKFRSLSHQLIGKLSCLVQECWLGKCLGLDIRPVGWRWHGETCHEQDANRK